MQRRNDEPGHARNTRDRLVARPVCHETARDSVDQPNLVVVDRYSLPEAGISIPQRLECELHDIALGSFKSAGRRLVGLRAGDPQVHELAEKVEPEWRA